MVHASLGEQQDLWCPRGRPTLWSRRHVPGPSVWTGFPLRLRCPRRARSRVRSVVGGPTDSQSSTNFGTNRPGPGYRSRGPVVTNRDQTSFLLSSEILGCRAVTTGKVGEPEELFIPTPRETPTRSGRSCPSQDQGTKNSNPILRLVPSPSCRVQGCGVKSVGDSRRHVHLLCRGYSGSGGHEWLRETLQPHLEQSLLPEPVECLHVEVARTLPQVQVERVVVAVQEQ